MFTGVLWPVLDRATAFDRMVAVFLGSGTAYAHIEEETSSRQSGAVRARPQRGIDGHPLPAADVAVAFFAAPCYAQPHQRWGNTHEHVKLCPGPASISALGGGGGRGARHSAGRGPRIERGKQQGENGHHRLRRARPVAGGVIQ